MVRQVRLVIPGSKLTVSPGDTIRVDVEFTYQGPAWRETLYSALYGYTFGMIDEVPGGAGSSAIDVPVCLQPTKITSYVLVPVPNRPGETFGIYAKLGNILSRYWDTVIEIALPVYEAPTAETLAASSIGGDSADIQGRLVSAGSHEEARCHFDWGKTTGYGSTTPYQWLRSGDEWTVKLTALAPNTTYHFRAVAYTTIGTDYGADRSFTTESLVTPGFQMRVINAPAGATQWRAGCVAGGTLPYMPTLQPLSYVWAWTKLVPGYELDFHVDAAGPWQDGFAPTIKSYQFPFFLRNDKRYVFDFGAYYPGIPDIRLMMKEE